MVLEDKHTFVGNVAFTFTKGRKSVTFTVQARLEVVRKTVGTNEQPLETWEAKASRKIIASAGFDTRHFEETYATFPCQLDMRADVEDWLRSFESLLLSAKFLEGTRKTFVRKLRAQKGTYVKGRIWEERI